MRRKAYMNTKHSTKTKIITTSLLLFTATLTNLISPSQCTLFPPKTVLTWINGIGFNIKHMNNGQINISSIFGNRPVFFCHNPTAMVDEDDTMGYIGDFAQATTQKLGKITNEVDELVKYV